ncbi:MAG: cell division protein ZapA [Gammaproteobacteria bacterium]|nr:cell division protein ZapA [Gammaproteobacteria bacterium]
MSQMYAHVNVKILDKEYQVACKSDERAELLDSAELLNSKMLEIRDSGKVTGLDRIAIMAALNLANELISSEGRGDSLESDAAVRIQAMRERVESALQSGQQLEI